MLAACRASGVGEVCLVARSVQDESVGTLPLRLARDLDAIDATARRRKTPALAIELTRSEPRDRQRAYTSVDVPGRQVFDLPRGRNGLAAQPDPEAYAEVLARIREAIRTEIAAVRGEAGNGEVLGVVHATSRYGPLVPVEDIVQMVGLLREADVHEVWCPVGDLPE